MSKILSLVTIILVNCSNLVDAQSISEALFLNPPAQFCTLTARKQSGSMWGGMVQIPVLGAYHCQFLLKR
jgi:hypothetical protein